MLLLFFPALSIYHVFFFLTICQAQLFSNAESLARTYSEIAAIWGLNVDSYGRFTRSNSNHGFTQSVGLRFSLLEG